MFKFGLRLALTFILYSFKEIKTASNKDAVLYFEKRRNAVQNTQKYFPRFFPSQGWIQSPAWVRSSCEGCGDRLRSQLEITLFLTRAKITMLLLRNERLGLSARSVRACKSI